MYTKDIFIRLCAMLVTFSVLFQPIIAGSYRKLSLRLWDQFARKRHITEKLLKSNNADVSLFKQKRTITHTNPCGDVEVNYVFTKDLDQSSSPGTYYYPLKLKEVKCARNALNQVNQPNCNVYTSGDCIDVAASITVLKQFSSGPPFEHDVQLIVGCACQAPNYK